MKLLITILAIGMLLASSLEAMEKTITNKRSADATEVNSSAPEASREQNHSTIDDLQRQLIAQAQAHTQFSATVMAQMTTMSETLKRLAEQQASKPQPKKRARRTTAMQPTTTQVPAMNAQPAAVNHWLENLRAYAMTASGRMLPSANVETTEAVTNALPHRPAQVEPTLIVKQEPIDNFRFVASPRIIIRPHEATPSDALDRAIPVQSAATALNQGRDASLETIHFAKPEPNEAQPATLAQIQELINGGASTPVTLAQQVGTTSATETQFDWSLKSPAKVLDEVRDLLKNKNYAPAMAPLKALCAQSQDLQTQAEAWLRLGVSHYCGFGVAKNYEEAVNFYQKAVVQSNNLSAQATAWLNFGHCYYFGNGVPKNYQEAIAFYMKAAAQNHNLNTQAYAWVLLADCYYEGNGAPKNYQEAVNFYQKATEQTHNLGSQADAWVRLARCHYHGHGVSRNFIEAVALCKKGAQQTHDLSAQAQAWGLLGRCYYYGHGVAKNYEEAITYFKKAADQTQDLSAQADAWLSLGICYQLGKGVPQNYQEAIAFLRKAANQTYNLSAQANAWLILGCCYCSVAKNHPEAISWLKKAADQTDSLRAQAKAWVRLGLCYALGQGVNYNYDAAVTFFKKASDEQQIHNVDAKAGALILLSACYLRGQGVTKDPNIAKHCLVKALDLPCDPKMKAQAQLQFTRLSANNTSNASIISRAEDETETEQAAAEITDSLFPHGENIDFQNL